MFLNQYLHVFDELGVLTWDCECLVGRFTFVGSFEARLWGEADLCLLPAGEPYWKYL